MMAAPAGRDCRARTIRSVAARHRPSARPPGDASQGDSRVVLVGEENAREDQGRLTRLLQQYPTTLAEVLRRDPTLLRNDAYLAPYPSLAAFLAQHPEVAHNPAYFLGGPQRDFYAERDPAIERARAVENIFSSFAVLVGLHEPLRASGMDD